MIKAIVTDIEGTTSSVSFVKDVLFPYASEHLPDFVRKHAEQADVRKLLNDVCEQVGQPLSDEDVICQLLDWIQQDKKVTPLKSLQGLIWEKGYQDGDFYGHIYPDAYQQLKTWQQQGIALYVYSSGSVYAQKLLYAHTEFGDLTPWFSGYFDTNIGAKMEADSYRRIVHEIGSPASQILFLSDIEAELDAAQQAGLHTCWLVRKGTPDGDAAHRQVASFDRISLDL